MGEVDAVMLSSVVFLAVMGLFEIPLSAQLTHFNSVNQQRIASQRIPQSHTDHRVSKSMHKKTENKSQCGII